MCSRTRRATRSASPAAWACSIASSVRPCPSNQVGSPGVQPRHEVRLPAQQLLGEHLPQNRVVAVPLPTPVERDDEEVAALELLQHAHRSGAPDGGVAQRAAHPREDRGSGEERQFRHPRAAPGPPHAGTSGVHRPLGAASPAPRARAASIVSPARYRRDGPALGAVEQVAEGVVVRRGARAAQQPARLAGGHREIGNTHFEDAPLQDAAGAAAGGGAVREAMAICQPRGSRRATSARMSWHSRFVTASTGRGPCTAGARRAGWRP